MMQSLTRKEKEYLQSLQSIDSYSKKRELTKEVLKALALGGAIATMFVLPGMAPGVKFFMDINDRRKQKLRRSLKALLRNGYVEEVKKDVYTVTSKGHVQLYKYAIDDLKILSSQKWDGHFHMITFDIPEQKKYARNALNKKLKELGFLTLQRSIYVYPFDFKKEFDDIGTLFGVKDNIVYIKTKDISNYVELQKEFTKRKIII